MKDGLRFKYHFRQYVMSSKHIFQSKDQWQYSQAFILCATYKQAQQARVFDCVSPIDIEGAKIDCLSLFMCLLLAQLIIGFFSFFCCGHLQY
jgi:hypothetical protein